MCKKWLHKFTIWNLFQISDSKNRDSYPKMVKVSYYILKCETLCLLKKNSVKKGLHSSRLKKNVQPKKKCSGKIWILTHDFEVLQLCASVRPYFYCEFRESLLNLSNIDFIIYVTSYYRSPMSCKKNFPNRLYISTQNRNQNKICICTITVWMHYAPETFKMWS